jgi:hypothetical protein
LAAALPRREGALRRIVSPADARTPAESDRNLMPVDLIHLLIGIAFVVVWGLACRILLATPR